jgi:acetyltransferase-like isoleucine patch superfamily enzyme
LKNRIFIYIQYFLRNIPGGFGQKIRSLLYQNFFGSWGNNVKIDIGVIFDNPSNIYLYSNINIKPYSHLTANDGTNLISLLRPIYFKYKDSYFGKIIISDNVTIGEFNILQGFGGILINQNCITNDRVSIYSMSHTIRNKNKPKQFSFANPMITISDNIPSISNSIELCEGAYVGYNSVIFSGIIGKHALIKSFSIVNNDFT